MEADLFFSASTALCERLQRRKGCMCIYFSLVFCRIRLLEINHQPHRFVAFTISLTIWSLLCTEDLPVFSE